MKEELRKYLTEEFLSCVQEEKQLLIQKKILEAAYEEYHESIGFYEEDEKKRQLFSPVIFLEPNFPEKKIQSSPTGQDLKSCEKALEQLYRKRDMLKMFMNEKEEAKTVTISEDNVPFLPEFYDLLAQTKLHFPDTDFIYTVKEVESFSPMTMKFLMQWKDCFRWIKQHLDLIYIDIQVNVEDTIEILMECGVETFSSERKEELEKHCGSFFAIEKTEDEDGFIIKITIE